MDVKRTVSAVALVALLGGCDKSGNSPPPAQASSLAESQSHGLTRTNGAPAAETPGASSSAAAQIPTPRAPSAPSSGTPAPYPTISATDWQKNFGQCLLSPDSHRFSQLWSAYDIGLSKKVTTNVPALSGMPVSAEVADFVTSLRKIGPILSAVDAIKGSDWMKKLYSDPNFLPFTASATFISIVENPEFVTEDKNPFFVHDYQTQPSFQASVNAIAAQLKLPDVRQAIGYFERKNLSFVSLDGLASALTLSNGLSGANVGTGAYLMNLPKPQPTGASDTFVQAYEDVIHDAIVGFLETNPTGVAALDQLQSPENTTAYDDYVVKAHQNEGGTGVTQAIFGQEYQVTPDQISAIDGVARTFWGEERGCETQGLAQFEIVGIVIADRTIAVENALAEQSEIAQENQQIDQKDTQVLLGSVPGQSAFGAIDRATQQGLGDFGIAGSSLLPVVQVVSKPEQFSAWNSYSTEVKTISEFNAQIPPGFPDVQFDYKVPQSSFDELALINVLCPQISENAAGAHEEFTWPEKSFPPSSDQAWSRAVELASLVVVDPKRYLSLFAVSPAPNGPLMFYVDGVSFPYGVRQPLSALVFNDPSTAKATKLPVLAPGAGGCDSLEIFSAAAGSSYGSGF